MFQDKLFVDIKGIDRQAFPINIEIKGTPVVVAPNQLGIDYKGDFPSFNLGNIMCRSAVFTREFRLLNTGRRDIQINWKMYNLDTSEEVDQKFFDVEVLPPLFGTNNLVSLNFRPIEPPEAKHGPFTLST